MNNIDEQEFSAGYWEALEAFYQWCQLGNEILTGLLLKGGIKIGQRDAREVFTPKVHEDYVGMSPSPVFPYEAMAYLLAGEGKVRIESEVSVEHADPYCPPDTRVLTQWQWLKKNKGLHPAWKALYRDSTLHGDSRFMSMKPGWEHRVDDDSRGRYIMFDGWLAVAIRNLHVKDRSHYHDWHLHPYHAMIWHLLYRLFEADNANLGWAISAVHAPELRKEAGIELGADADSRYWLVPHYSLREISARLAENPHWVFAGRDPFTGEILDEKAPLLAIAPPETERGVLRGEASRPEGLLEGSYEWHDEINPGLAHTEYLHQPVPLFEGILDEDGVPVHEVAPDDNKQGSIVEGSPRDDAPFSDWLISYMAQPGVLELGKWVEYMLRLREKATTSREYLQLSFAFLEREEEREAVEAFSNALRTFCMRGGQVTSPFWEEWIIEFLENATEDHLQFMVDLLEMYAYQYGLHWGSINDELLKSLLHVYAHQRRVQKFELLWEPWLETHMKPTPETARFMFELGDAYRALDDFTNALKQYKAGFRLDIATGIMKLADFDARESFYPRVHEVFERKLPEALAIEPKAVLEAANRLWDSHVPMDPVRILRWAVGMFAAYNETIGDPVTEHEAKVIIEHGRRHGTEESLGTVWNKVKQNIEGDKTSKVVEETEVG